MGPRTGRPKADNPKTVNYTIRLDVKSENRLKEYCANLNISRGEAIRRGIYLLLERAEGMADKERKDTQQAILYELRRLLCNGDKETYTKEELCKLLDTIAEAKAQE